MLNFKKCELRPTLITILVSGMLLQCFTTVDSRPNRSDNGYTGGASSENAIVRSSSSNNNNNAIDTNNSKSCATSSHVRNVCEMCAKVTRSRVVFPMCCATNDQAGTRTWCLKFLNFGLTDDVWSFS